MFDFVSVAQQLEERKKMEFDSVSVAQQLETKKMMFDFVSVAQKFVMQLKPLLLTDSDSFYPSVITYLKPVLTKLLAEVPTYKFSKKYGYFRWG